VTYNTEPAGALTPYPLADRFSTSPALWSLTVTGPFQSRRKLEGNLLVPGSLEDWFGRWLSESDSASSALWATAESEAETTGEIEATFVGI
jgi:hypothetical protein